MLLVAGRFHNFEPRVKSALRGSSPVLTMSKQGDKVKGEYPRLSIPGPGLWFIGGLKYCGRHYNQPSHTKQKQTVVVISHFLVGDISPASICILRRGSRGIGRPELR